MIARKFALSAALALALAAAILAPGLTTSTAHAQDPVEAPEACTALFKQKWMPKGNCNTNGATHFLGTLDNQPLVFKTNATERMRIDAAGNIALGPAGGVYGYMVTGNGAPGPNYPTLSFNTHSSSYRAGTAGHGGIFQFQSGDGALIYYTGSNVAAGQPHVNTPRFILQNAGNVGVGTTFPAAKLEVKGGGSSITSWIFRAVNASDQAALTVYTDRSVNIGAFKEASVIHVCNNLGFLAHCSLSAQYVPSIDGGSGYPQTAELVSIAPTRINPYLDTHAPFAVQKSTAPCDSNLLGIISDPATGADGEKKNEHYLPLVLTGNLPVKVTLENGPIKRGDSLTSSSKPGYAMKATSACKTIGYALEDANAEGTVQVFAHLSENAAPQVAQLQERVNELEQHNAALEARLATIERAMQVQTQPADNRNAAFATTR